MCESHDHKKVVVLETVAVKKTSGYSIKADPPCIMESQNAGNYFVRVCIHTTTRIISFSALKKNLIYFKFCLLLLKYEAIWRRGWKK